MNEITPHLKVKANIENFRVGCSIVENLLAPKECKNFENQRNFKILEE